VVDLPYRENLVTPRHRKSRQQGDPTHQENGEGTAQGGSFLVE
jgi:hypothetical protein